MSTNNELCKFIVHRVELTQRVRKNFPILKKYENCPTWIQEGEEKMYCLPDNTFTIKLLYNE